MALDHQLITLSASGNTQLNFSASALPDYCQGVTISVQNVSNNTVYLGNGNTSSVSYGFKLSPGQAFSADLDPYDNLHGIASASGTQVAVTRLTWQ